MKKETDIQNPEILVKDGRIEKLDTIVSEVNESIECPRGQTLGGIEREHL